MAPLWIIKELNVIEHVGAGLIARAVDFASRMRSVFSEEKKLSMAALSQTLPERLMLHATPLSAMSF